MKRGSWTGRDAQQTLGVNSGSLCWSQSNIAFTVVQTSGTPISDKSVRVWTRGAKWVATVAQSYYKRLIKKQKLHPQKRY